MTNENSYNLKNTSKGQTFEFGQPIWLMWLKINECLYDIIIIRMLNVL